MSENIILKFSDLIKNDGAFDEIRNELDDLEKDLISRAKRLKGIINIGDVFDTERIKELESDIEVLRKSFKNLGETREGLNKIEKEYQKQLEKSVKSQDKQLDVLVKLDKELVNQRLEIIKINAAVKSGNKTEKEAAKLRVKAQVEIKRIRKEINKQQKEIIESNELSKDEQKLIKAKITLDKEQVKTISQVRERIAALRVVVQSLDIEEQADQIAAFNQEINDLTDVLSANSDKFIQSKINIGNYEESILNALNNTSLFSTGIGVLDGAISGLIQALTINGDQLDQMEESLKDNSNALRKMTVSFGRLNKVLKASIIGTVIVALAALVSLFGDTRAGAIRLEKVMNTLSTAFTTFGQIARVGFNGVIDLSKSAVNNVKSLSNVAKQLFLNVNPIAAMKESTKLLKQNKDASDNLKKSWQELVNAFDVGFDSIIEGLENIERSFKIQDTIRGLERDLAKLNGQLSLLEGIADDSTRSLNAQLRANELALRKAEEIAAKELEIAKLNLEEVNERIKQNAKANVEETKRLNLALKGADFAEATLKLAQQRGAQLEISNSLLDEQQEAVLALTQAENNRNVTIAENEKKRREIQRDLFEQNLDLLIDLIDTEKNLSEEQVRDTAKNFQDRVKEFNRFLLVFRQNAQKELGEFNKQAKNLGLDLDFEIDFKEDGSFEVFTGDTRLAIDNIKELNEQLQNTGLGEIEINRFREFLIETRNAQRDFKGLNKELGEAGIRVNELFNNLAVDRAELIALDVVNNKLRELSKIKLNPFSRNQRRFVLKEIEALEKEREKIQKNFEKQRLDNRIEAIDSELEKVEKGSERELELQRERVAIEKKIRETSIEEENKAVNDNLIKQEKIYKEFIDKITKIIDLIGKAFVDNAKKQTEEAKTNLADQEEATNEQRRRAEQGLANTLAFEQRELAKREAELVKKQKREENIQKLQAFWSSYNANLKALKDNEDSSVAISKTLRDTAIIEAITASIGSFEKGGIVGRDGFDHVRTNSKGVTIGQSHNVKNGILAFHQGGEGFFSRQEVAALGGESEFYKWKEMATSGKLSENFFSSQSRDFIKAVPVQDNSFMISELREIKKTIEKQPVSNWEVAEVTNSTFRIVEKTIQGNKTKRNSHIIKKPRP